MKLCALILAHHSPVLLARLCRRLGQFDVSCFVHLDARTGIEPFQTACDGSGASFIAERLALKWGGFSIVAATLTLIEQALAGSDASHFLLISGDTYPTAGKDAFDRYFLTADSRIRLREIGEGSDLYERIARTYIPDHRIGQLRSAPFDERYLTDDFIENLEDIRRVYTLKKETRFPWKFAKGSQWWCLRRDAVTQALRVAREDAEFVDWFRYSVAADETFFQTVLLNFAPDRIVNSQSVFTIWDRQPRPYVFTRLEDIETLRAGKEPVARKFTEDSHVLLDQLDRL